VERPCETFLDSVVRVRPVNKNKFGLLDVMRMRLNR
jgi:hypothetical protein